MKIQVILLTVLFFPVLIYAQFSGEQEINYCDACKPSDILAVDLDGDRDLDVVACATSNNQLIWYRNDGTGEYSPAILISSELESPRAIFSGDMDGDYDMDILSASANDNKIAWYSNDGKGNFTYQKMISDNAKGASDVLAIDLDGDSDLDVISASRYDNKIAWYENDGKGNFSNEIILIENLNDVSSIKIEDLDNDYKADITAIGNYGKLLVWFKNLGNGEFSARKSISEKNRGLTVFQIADIDKDGNKDIICNYRDGFLFGKLIAYKNEGLGEFSKPMIIEGYANDIKDLVVEDINNDGNLDLIAFAEGSSCISWYKNNGSFDNFEKILIKDKIFLSQGGNIRLVDIDNDEQLDILYTEKEDRIGWFKNNGTFIFRDHIDIAKNFEEAKYVHPIDIDQDEDVDLIAALGNQVAIFKNQGNGRFDFPIRVSQNLEQVNFVYPIDLDKDQNIDILFTEGIGEHRIGWYKNNGNEKFSKELFFSTDLEHPFRIKPADIDNDGDIDIICSEFTSNGKIVLIQNNGGDFSPPKKIAEYSKYIYALEINDFDLDDDLDIGFASKDTIGWLENNGHGIFDKQHIITDIEEIPTNLFLVDLNGDNIKDLLIKGVNLTWYQGIGKGKFMTRTIIPSPDGVNRKIYPCNVDNDLDIDIVFADFGLTNKNAFGWYENKGEGIFSKEQIISKYTAPANNITTADLNNDDKVDIIYTGFWHGKIAWFKNVFQ